MSMYIHVLLIIPNNPFFYYIHVYLTNTLVFSFYLSVY
jgi:hypothetical protein